MSTEKRNAKRDRTLLRVIDMNKFVHQQKLARSNSTSIEETKRGERKVFRLADVTMNAVKYSVVRSLSLSLRLYLDLVNDTSMNFLSLSFFPSTKTSEKDGEGEREKKKDHRHSLG